MKSRFILLICLFVSAISYSQEKKFDFEVYGWVSPQYYLNSRQCVEGRDGLLCLYPAAPSINAYGKDQNAVWNHNFSASMTRIGTRIFMNDVLNARVVGTIEGDFTGQTDANIHLLRLRQANVKMTWSKLALTFGHGWNVFCVPEMMPTMQELNNGAPFHPFSRVNHIRADYRIAKSLTLVGSLGWQRDYASIGVDGGRDYRQLNRSMLPELNLQIQFRQNGLLAGLTGEMKTLKPILEYEETVTSFAANAFVNYRTKNWDFRLQAVYGENLNDYCMLGGYQQDVDFANIGNPYSYIPSLTSTIWFEVSYLGNQKITPAFFAAYADHTKSDKLGLVNCGSGMHIDRVYRIAPRIDFNFTKDFFLSTIAEYTNAHYLTDKMDESVGNWRLGITLMYKFSNK